MSSPCERSICALTMRTLHGDNRKDQSKLRWGHLRRPRCPTQAFLTKGRFILPVLDVGDCLLVQRCTERLRQSVFLARLDQDSRAVDRMMAPGRARPLRKRAYGNCKIISAVEAVPEGNRDRRLRDGKITNRYNKNEIGKSRDYPQRLCQEVGRGHVECHTDQTRLRERARSKQ